MKIRNSFVTNSSSSSFLIATRSTANKSDLEKELENIYNQNTDRINSALDLIFEWVEEEDDFYEDNEKMLYRAFKNKDENFVKAFTDFVLENILKFTNDGCKLDSWNASVGDCSNEDEEIFSQFLYDAGYLLNSDNIKFN